MRLRVGEVADRAGVKPDTVRYYEDTGLLEPAGRSDAGYRQFAEDAVERIRFIKRAQGLGFTLEEIAGLLDLRLREGDACGPVQRMAGAKIAEIDGKIAFLLRLRHSLAQLVTACVQESPTEECPLLESLGTEQDA